MEHISEIRSIFAFAQQLRIYGIRLFRLFLFSGEISAWTYLSLSTYLQCQSSPVGKSINSILMTGAT